MNPRNPHSQIYRWTTFIPMELTQSGPTANHPASYQSSGGNTGQDPHQSQGTPSGYGASQVICSVPVDQQRGRKNARARKTKVNTNAATVDAQPAPARSARRCRSSKANDKRPSSPEPRGRSTSKSKPEKKLRSGQKIPRPANAFIIFRSHFCAMKKVSKKVENDNRLISCIAGTCWENMSDDERAVWFEEAERVKQLHKIRHPDYHYSPFRRTGDEIVFHRSMNRNGVEDLERCKRIGELISAGLKGAELDAAVEALGIALADELKRTRSKSPSYPRRKRVQKGKSSNGLNTQEPATQSPAAFSEEEHSSGSDSPPFRSPLLPTVELPSFEEQSEAYVLQNAEQGVAYADHSTTFDGAHQPTVHWQSGVAEANTGYYGDNYELQNTSEGGMNAHQVASYDNIGFASYGAPPVSEYTTTYHQNTFETHTGTFQAYTPAQYERTLPYTGFSQQTPAGFTPIQGWYDGGVDSSVAQYSQPNHLAYQGNPQTDMYTSQEPLQRHYNRWERRMTPY